MSAEAQAAGGTIPPKWTPLGRVERRVLGVLVEKAKTTPDAYPLTLNALTNGCNQKSNRDPQMNLQPDQVENSLEKLRHLSAVIEVSGGGRVSKYRHLIYEWMGINKVEAAVMTELLLRGAQTVGELRGRAARMEPIADVGALMPVLESLQEKGLVISLTPSGRGQIVTHALFLPEEMAKVKASAAASSNEPAVADRPAAPTTTTIERSPSAGRPGQPGQPAPSADSRSRDSGSLTSEVAELRSAVEQLRAEVDRLKSDVQDLWSSLS